MPSQIRLSSVCLSVTFTHFAQPVKILRNFSMHGVWLGELPKIWRFPLNMFAMAEASDFKFGTSASFNTVMQCSRRLVVKM